MPGEHSEHTHTEHALEQVFQYISPGTNEGVSFSLSRLTDDLFTDSFLAGGDISLFTASGRRGTIKSQLSNGWLLDSNAGAPTQFPIELEVDLNHGSASGSWTLPDGSSQTPHFQLQHVKTSTQPEGCSASAGRQAAMRLSTASRSCSSESRQREVGHLRCGAGPAASRQVVYEAGRVILA